MKFILTLALALSVLLTFGQGQDYHTVRGYVYDENNVELPGVEIRVKNTGLGTITNENGQYELRLEKGLNRLVFSYMGYKSQTIDVVVSKDQVQNVWLQPDENLINTVEINRKKNDISNLIIKHVIDHRDSLDNLYQTRKCNVYIKSVENTINREKKKDSDEDGNANFDKFENNANPESDSSAKIANLNLYEAQIVRHFKKPGDLKEERLAVKKFGDQSSLFYTSTTEGDFDLYDNLIYIRSLGQNALTSPFSNTAFIAYKFKMENIYQDSLGKKVYVIKVIPRKLGNALFKGEVEIYAGEWVLKSASLSVPKTALVLYDEFSFYQEYGDVNGKHIVVKQVFNWSLKTNHQKTDGTCIARYSNEVFDTLYAKKFFNAELRITEKSAYEKDSAFWSNIRPEPLTQKEQVFVRYQDSLRMIRTSKHYLDSIDSLYNRITFLNLVWHGQGYINREKKENIEFSPLVSMLDPVAIGGWRVRYNLSYYRRFKNRKSIYVSPFFNYGFKNHDPKGSLYINFLYNPKKLSFLSFRTGKYFDFVNPYASLRSIIRRNNFFETTYVGIAHRTELINGLYIGTDFEVSHRNSLANFQFAAIGDTLFQNNLPVDFVEHNAAIHDIYIEFTPKQLYLQEPYEKIVLGSKYPTFSLSWTKAWNNIFNSIVKYSFVEFDIEQKFNVGIFGVSHYRINMGKFLDTTSLRVMDYKYQRAGDPFFFTPSMYTYQLLDSTFPTFRFFIEGHYTHQFNGFIMNRVPLLKKTQIKTMVGGGFLYAPERNYQYSELFCGANRVLKIGKERLRLGVHYVVAQSNHFGFRSMFKVSFEFYNRTKNTWSF